MKNSTVSVIVPHRNEEWLSQCLASIGKQDYADIELIVIDDTKSTGAGAARNRGLEKATGEYVMFCDADDYLESGAIRKMVDAIKGADLVAGSFRKFGDFEAVVSHEARMSAGLVAEYVMGNLENPRSNQMLSGCWAKLYKRSKCGTFPALTTAEDMAFNFDYLRRCEMVVFLKDIVYHNRKRSGSLSTTYDPANKPGLFGFLKGLEYVKRFLSRFYTESMIDTVIDNSKMYHSMLYFTRICAQTGWSPNEAMRKLYP